MPRPKKKEKLVLVNFKATPEEIKEMKKMARKNSYLHLSAYIRDCVLERNPHRRKPTA